MIVFPQALILALAGTAAPLTHGRFGYQTHTYGALPSQVTVSGATADGPADAPLRPETNEYWEPPSLPATWEFLFDGIQTIDYAGIGGHTLGTNGCSVEAETSLDGTTWDALGTEHTPSDDAPIMFLDEDRDAIRLRLTITGTGAAPRLASIYVGKTLAMSRPIYSGHSPISLSRQTRYQSSVSRGGQFLGQAVQSMGVAGTINFSHLTAAWYRANFDKLVEHARSGRPFFYGWRPETFPNEVVYVWTTGDIAPVNSGPRDFMSVGMSVQGIGWVRNG
jgi:hypothetical protein